MRSIKLLLLFCFISLSITTKAEQHTLTLDDIDTLGGVISNYSGVYKDIIIPENLGGKAVTAIQSGTFLNKGLTSVVIPNSITTIGAVAFMGNELMSIVIPNSVTLIENAAFHLNSFTLFNLPDSYGGSEYYWLDLDGTDYVSGQEVTVLGQYVRGAITGILTTTTQTFSFYPSPSTDYIEITGNLSMIDNISIVNSKGDYTSVATNLSSSRIDISHFDLGVYIIIINTNGESLKQRLVIGN